MDQITNKQIKREAMAMQMCYNFSAYDFCELAAKFEYDAGYSKEDAERMAIEAMRSMKR